MGSAVRINIFLALMLGISRRKADRMISENDIQINGTVALLGQIIDPVRDRVTVDGLVVGNRPVTTTRIALY